AVAGSSPGSWRRPMWRATMGAPTDGPPRRDDSMLTQRATAIARFTRSDAMSLGIASAILILVMTVILGAGVLTQSTLDVQAGDLAPRDIVAPRAASFE